MAGVDVARLPRQVTIREAKQMQRFYEQGRSIRWIARYFDRSLGIVHRHLVALGVDMRPAHVTTPLTAEVVQETADMYEAGLSCAKVGALVGISERGVRHRLQRGGVERRSKSKRAPGYSLGRAERMPIAALVPLVKQRVAGESREDWAVLALGVDPRTWYDWKRGARTMAHFETADAVLVGLGLNPWDVWRPEDDPEVYALAARLWGFDLREAM